MMKGQCPIVKNVPRAAEESARARDGTETGVWSRLWNRRKDLVPRLYLACENRSPNWEQELGTRVLMERKREQEDYLIF